MSEAMQLWGEIVFNVAYLVIVWGLVWAMIRRLPQLSQANHPLARLFIWAFALLALGDSGHVGFRVLAYAAGSLETTLTVIGVEVGLVGIGVFSTSVTVTIFYALMLMIWRVRFDQQYGGFGLLLFLAAAVRLVLMLFPQNEWSRIVSPQPWATYRNLPLLVQGLGAAYLILRDAIANKDRTFKWVGVMILVSYAFYVPVVLFVEVVPMIGMLMIPKTMAYVAIAWVAFTNVFRKTSPESLRLGKER